MWRSLLGIAFCATAAGPAMALAGSVEQRTFVWHCGDASSGKGYDASET